MFYNSEKIQKKSRFFTWKCILLFVSVAIIITACSENKEESSVDNKLKSDISQIEEEENVAIETGSSNVDNLAWAEYDIANQHVKWMNDLWELEYLYPEVTDELKQLVHDGLTGIVWTNGFYSFTFNDDTVIIQHDNIESEYEYQFIAVCGTSFMDEGYTAFNAIIRINGEYLSLGRMVMYLDDGSPYLMLYRIDSDGLSDGITLDAYDNFIENGMPEYASNSEFIEKIWAEENTLTNMNIGQLIRDPSMYIDDTMYRFTGYVRWIDRSETSSRAILEIGNSAIVIEYPGWIGAVTGDQLTVYGYVSGIKEYTHSVQGIVQTAGIEAVYYTVGVGSENCEFTEEQWEFITGDWYADDNDRYIESTVTLTKDTINGRPYSIRKAGIGTHDLQFAFGSDINSQGSQYLFLEITTEAANGETINAGLSFDFGGGMVHNVYHGEVFYIVNFYR